MQVRDAKELGFDVVRGRLSDDMYQLMETFFEPDCDYTYRDNGRVHLFHKGKRYYIIETRHNVIGKAGRDDATQAMNEGMAARLEKLERVGYSEEIRPIGRDYYPMLAKTYVGSARKTKGHEIRDPTVLTQPKLDGIRCMTRLDPHTGIPMMVTRAGFRLDHLLPQFRTELQHIFARYPWMILDGELYIHGLTLQRISGACRNTQEDPLHAELKYVLFTHCSSDPVENRYALLEDVLRDPLTGQSPVFLREEIPASRRVILNYQAEMETAMADEWMKEFVQRGFEGIMMYIKGSPYDGPSMTHRSNYLVKHKPCMDIEGQIVRITREKRDDGRDLALFICRVVNPIGKEIEVVIRPSLTDGERMHIYANQQQYLDRYLQIIFSGWTEDWSLQQPTMKQFVSYID